MASCDPTWGPGTRPFAQKVPASEKRVGKRVSGSRRRGLVPPWRSTQANHSLPPHPHVRKPIISASRGRGAPYRGCPALQSTAPPPLPARRPAPLPANCKKRGCSWRRLRCRPAAAYMPLAPRPVVFNSCRSERIALRSPGVPGTMQACGGVISQELFDETLRFCSVWGPTAEETPARSRPHVHALLS